MPEKIVFSNKISKPVRARFDKAIKANGHLINFVLENLLEFYSKYGLPTEKNADVKKM